MAIQKLDIDPTQSVATNHCIINKINELIDTVNRLLAEVAENARIRANHEKKIDELQESVQGVVNNSINDGGRIRLLQEQIHALKTTMANNANVAENCECAKNAHELVTITDMFNEMGRLYADLWNKMEDIHHELRNKGGKDE